MSTERLKSRLDRLKRRKPTRAEYQAACSRHDARLTVMIEDLRGAAMRVFGHDSEQDRLIEFSRKRLGTDSKVQWLRDASVIERYCGSRREARRHRAWGRSPKAMLVHLEALEWAEIKARDPSAQRIMPSDLPPPYCEMLRAINSTKSVVAYQIWLT